MGHGLLKLLLAILTTFVATSVGIMAVALGLFCLGALSTALRPQMRVAVRYRS